MLGNRIRRASAAGDVKDRGPLRGVLRTSLTNLLAPANFHLRGAEAPPLKKGTPLHLNFAAFLSYGWGAPPSTLLVLSLFMPAIFGQGDVGGPGGPGGGAEVIPKGSDFFTTPAGGQTFQDFGPTPIPPGFFGPDCDGFDGIIQLMGVPLPSLGLTDTIVERLDDAVLMGVRGKLSLGSTDTIVERLDDAVLPGVGSSAQIDIQLVALSLQSLHPITVMCGGGETPVKTFWVADFQVNGDNPQQKGTMEIRKEHNNGGTFDSTLFVSPIITFFKAPDFQEFRRLGGFETGPLPAIEFHTEGTPWLSDKMNCDVVELVRPVQLPFFNLEVQPTTPNFHAGLALDPKKDHCKWVLVQEDALLARHGVLAVPTTTGPDFDEDGIEDQCDNCPNVFNPFSGRRRLGLCWQCL